MKKTIFCFLLAGVMASNFVACGSSDTSTTVEEITSEEMTEPTTEQIIQLSENMGNVFDVTPSMSKSEITELLGEPSWIPSSQNTYYYFMDNFEGDTEVSSSTQIDWTKYWNKQLLATNEEENLDFPKSKYLLEISFESTRDAICLYCLYSNFDNMNKTVNYVRKNVCTKYMKNCPKLKGTRALNIERINYQIEEIQSKIAEEQKKMSECASSELRTSYDKLIRTYKRQFKSLNDIKKKYEDMYLLYEEVEEIDSFGFIKTNNNGVSILISNQEVPDWANSDVKFIRIQSGSGKSSGNYDKNDKYYSENDHDHDGYINDKEFQDAVGDWMDDHGY